MRMFDIIAKKRDGGGICCQHNDVAAFFAQGCEHTGG